ncbi:MAG: cytochrome c oxidase subunit, partial [Candidatus Eisenbacteria bacterium]
VGSYYTVAHAHEMLFGGVVMGLLAGLYLHAPRLFARALDARAGQVHFSLTVVGAVLTFLPMHVLGLAGMPRRIHSYLPGTGWDAMNALASVGAIVLLAAGVAFVLAIVRAKPVAAPAAVTPASSTSDGPLVAAVGLALLAVGTLLGWVFGGAGALLLVFGVVRSGTVRTESPAA